ncbi:MAG: hypothetical protein V4563_07895 [Pseudomonadota bacterium]
MTILILLAIGIFLPLFPLSVVWTAFFKYVPWAWLRALIVLVWPQIGLTIAFSTHVQLPQWVAWWGLMTAALYALRMLSLRDFSTWIAFISASAFALLWIGLVNANSEVLLRLQGAGFSASFILAVVVVPMLKNRLGAAYSGLHCGMAQRLPKLAGVLVLAVLAATATPLFPSFFTLIAVLSGASFMVAVGMLIVWLLWSWAGVRLLQGFLPGVWSRAQTPPDLSLRTSWLFGLGLVTLVGAATVLSSMGLTGGW